MIHFPTEKLLPLTILAVIEPNAAAGAHSFNHLLDTVRNWRGFGYRFQVLEHVHQRGSITPELIRDADELWFFGTELCVRGTDFVSLGDTEIAAIGERMEAGVGVFATGDHEDIGSGLCAAIPRVGNMRVWRGAQAPRQLPPRSYDSTFRSAQRDIVDPDPQAKLCKDFDQLDDRDATPKPIWVFHRADGRPHELMQLPLRGVQSGRIRFLPNHRHEGLLFDLHERADPAERAALEAEYQVGAIPRIVARSVRSVFDTVHGQPVDCASYPVVSAYEAPEASGRGNIVVESTFHHWADSNALRLRFSPAWLHVEQYAINVANWLLGTAGCGKVRPAVQDYLRATVHGGDEILALISAGDAAAAFERLNRHAGLRMSEQRVVADMLRRILGVSLPERRGS